MNKKRIMLHPKDTMTSEERIQAAVNLRVPDRVPLVPIIYYFAAAYSGITNAELYDPKKYNKAIDKVFYELGPWDSLCYVNAYYRELASILIPMRVKEPGFDLPPDSIRQFVEEELMLEKDYDWIIRTSKKNRELAYGRTLMRFMPRIWDHIGKGWRAYAYMAPRLTDNFLRVKLEAMRWERRGATTAYSFLGEAPFDNFSMARGLVNFARDIRKYPREIVEAADGLVDGYIRLAKNMTYLLGVQENGPGGASFLQRFHLSGYLQETLLPVHEEDSGRMCRGRDKSHHPL